MQSAAVRARNLKKLKAKKQQIKIAAKKARKNKIGFIAMVALIIIIIVLAVPLFNNRMKILEKNEAIIELNQEYNSRRIHNDALQQKINAPVDEEYIAEIARENGYRKSDEILFYLNDGK